MAVGLLSAFRSGVEARQQLHKIGAGELHPRSFRFRGSGGGSRSNVAARDLDRPDFQCFVVNLELDLAPDPALWKPILAGVPLTFLLDTDPCVVDLQIQRTLTASMRDVHGNCLLEAAYGAEIQHLPAQANQSQQSLDEPCCLPLCEKG